LELHSVKSLNLTAQLQGWLYGQQRSDYPHPSEATAANTFQTRQTSRWKSDFFPSEFRLDRLSASAAQKSLE